MKVILCYGDSNTWGWNPSTQNRYKRDERWPGVLQEHLGENYYVIEEGLPGRTTVWDDPLEEYKNGRDYLIPCLASNRPINLVVLMLGTNDLKKRFSLPVSDIAKGVGVLIEIIQKSGAGLGGSSPKILLLAPPPLLKLTNLTETFEDGYEKSRKLSLYYRQIADQYGCSFLDTAEVITSSRVDGIHLDVTEHQKLGRLLAAGTRKLV